MDGPTSSRGQETRCVANPHLICRRTDPLIGQEGALAVYKEILGKEKAVSTGQKIQITLNTIRIGLFHSDVELVKTNIAEAKK